MRRHVFDAAKEWPLSIKTLRLQTVERLIIIQAPRQIRKLEHVAAQPMHAKEGRFRSIRFNRHQRRPFWRPIFFDRGGELRDGGQLEQRRQRPAPAESLLDLREQTHGQERMAAEIEKVFTYPDVRDAQDFAPNLG